MTQLTLPRTLMYGNYESLLDVNEIILPLLIIKDQGETLPNEWFQRAR